MSCPLDCYHGLGVVDQCCSVVERKGWKRIIINVTVVLLYQVLRACYKGSPGASFDRQATSSYIFLIAATIWLTALDLSPACLYIWPAFILLYDIIAVTVLANLLLNYIWSEIILFINTMTYHMYEYSEDTKLGEIFQYIFDKDGGYICLVDVIAFFILIWVLTGLGLLSNFIKSIQCSLTQLEEPDVNNIADDEVARRIIECCMQSTKKVKKKIKKENC